MKVFGIIGIEACDFHFFDELAIDAFIGVEWFEIDLIKSNNCS